MGIKSQAGALSEGEPAVYATAHTATTPNFPASPVDCDTVTREGEQGPQFRGKNLSAA